MGGGRSSFWEMPSLQQLWDLHCVLEASGSPDKCSGLWYTFESLAHCYESKPAQGKDSTGGTPRLKPERPTSPGEEGSTAIERNRRQTASAADLEASGSPLRTVLVVSEAAEKQGR